MSLETLLKVGGTGLQGVGAVVGGVQDYRAGGYSAATTLRYGEYNAQVLERNAEIERLNAEIEAGRILRKGRRFAATQRTEFARSQGGAEGVDVGQGSPLLVQLDTIREAAENAMLARLRGEVTATGAETAAETERITSQEEARLQRVAGRRALIGGIGKASNIALEYAYGLPKFLQKKKKP